MKTILSLLLNILWMSSMAQTFTPLIENLSSSFRGIAAYGNKTIWVSGSSGTVGQSMDQGKTWKWVNPQGYENFDFRDIEVFSSREAVVMSAGSPAVILRTTDSGRSWQEVFRDSRPQIFLNAITFEGNTGYALGDPIDGLFQLLKTADRGKSWTNVSNDMVLFADEEEVAFAASGSSIQLLKGNLFVGTGGRYSSLFSYNPKELRVDKYDCPIWSGDATTGIFAIDFLNRKYGIAVGGNYESDKDNRNNILITRDGGFSWQKPSTPVLGFRSDILFLTKNTVIATGTSGIDISVDAGLNWKNISDLGFNSLAKSKDNKTIYLTGSRGNVFKLTL